MGSCHSLLLLLLLTGPPNSITMDGKYVLKSNENYDAFLIAAGIPADVAAVFSAAKPTLEVTKNSNGLTVKTIANDKTFTNTIVFGTESTNEIAGLQFQLNAKQTATGYAGTMSFGGKSGTVACDKTADGFCQPMTLAGVPCKKYYTKQ